MTAKLLVPATLPGVAPIDGGDLRVLAASGDEIGWLRWLIEVGRWSRRSREERGVWCCEEMNEGKPLFIVAEGARGLRPGRPWRERSGELEG
jgi:hypothetical protein